MLWRTEESIRNYGHRRSGVLFAGPGSSLTIPGIIASEIVQALASDHESVTRIEVDVAPDFMAGLHRARSLSAAHGSSSTDSFTTHRAPSNSRVRTQMFRDLVSRNVGTAIAYAWPGIDNTWIRSFVQAANAAGVSTIVACASVPATTQSQLSELASQIYQADRVYVGEVADAEDLRSAMGSRGPVINIHSALSLRGRTGRLSDRSITTFLPKDSEESLATVLAAFDAIPEAWITNFRLDVVVRFTGDSLPEMVAGSHHSDHVQLIGDDISSSDLSELCSNSSALGIADPNNGSRAFSSAVESGVATVVLSSSSILNVGRGYVGGLVADLRQPASVHVAINHALRLEALRFPSPLAWNGLARQLIPVADEVREFNFLEPIAND